MSKVMKKEIAVTAEVLERVNMDRRTPEPLSPESPDPAEETPKPGQPPEGGAAGVMVGLFVGVLVPVFVRVLVVVNVAVLVGVLVGVKLLVGVSEGVFVGESVGV